MNNVLVTGGTGMLGSAVARALSAARSKNVMTPTHLELDLLNQDAVEKFFCSNEVHYVIHCAADIGGIASNSQRHYRRLLNNMRMNSNIIEAFRHNCDLHEYSRKLLLVGSTNAYPLNDTARIAEEDLLNGPLERQSEGYALSKVLGVKLCTYLGSQPQYAGKFISCMPPNIYGINCTFDLENSHVIPATIMKIDYALRNNLNTISVLGDGSQVRSFIYSDDLAEALLLLLRKYSSEFPINVGSGVGIKIKDVIEKTAKLMGFNGQIVYSKNAHSGCQCRVEDPRKIFQLGWRPTTAFEDGLKSVIEYFNTSEK